MMDPQIQAAWWMLLTGFSAVVVTFAIHPIFGLSTPKELTSKTKVIGKIRSIQIYKILIAIAIALQAPAILLGIHLIRSGYDVDLTKADPTALARGAAKARGRGGIIILIVQFLPYFLIGGYGYLAWQLLDLYNAENRRIKSLKTIYSHLFEATPSEVQSLEKILTTLPSELSSGNPEHLAGAFIKELQQRNKSDQTGSSAKACPPSKPQNNQDSIMFKGDINL